MIVHVRNSDQGPLEPMPEPTSVPTIGPTMVATPASPESAIDPAPSPEPGSLIHLLGYAGDRLRDNSLPLSDIAQYADIQRWMDARGIAMPTGPDDPAWDAWRAELPTLALPEILAMRGTDEVWISTYGFGLHDVQQVLAVGSAPDYIIVMRGNFDQETLNAAWAESGYQAVRVDGVTYWSLYPGGSVDLSAPSSRPALGNMNNIALLDDGTLIAATRSGRLEQAIRTAQGSNPSLAANDDIRNLLAPGIEPNDLMTAILLKGSVLEIPAATARVGVVAIATPSTTVPQAKMMLVGLRRPIESQIDTMVIVTLYDSAPDATGAYRRVDREFRGDTSTITNAPYTDRLQPLAMRVVASEGGDYLLFMQFTPLQGASDWMQIVEERDFGFIMWPRVP